MKINKEMKKRRELTESHELAVDILRLLSSMPEDEYENPDSLSNEIKRTAISIPSKISAGYELGGDFLRENIVTARGLTSRLETLFILALVVNLVDNDKSDVLIERIERVRELLTEITG